MCDIVNEPFAIVLTKVVASAAAAFAVNAVRTGVEPTAQFTAGTTVVAALAVNVTAPVALDRP